MKPYQQVVDKNSELQNKVAKLEKLYKEACASEDALISISKVQSGVLTSIREAINDESMPSQLYADHIREMKKELQFLRSEHARWKMETSIINDILDGNYDPLPHTFDYETELSDKIKKLMENKA